MNEYKVMCTHGTYLIKADNSSVENDGCLWLYNNQSGVSKVQAVFKNWDFFWKKEEVIDD